MADPGARKSVAVAALVTCGVAAGSMSWAVAAVHESVHATPVVVHPAVVSAAPLAASPEVAALRREIAAANVTLRTLAAERAAAISSSPGAAGVITVSQSAPAASGGVPQPSGTGASASPAPAPTPAPTPTPVVQAPAPTPAPVVQATTGASGVVH